MTKVLFILSAVVMLVSCFFAYENGRKFASTRNQVTELGGSINAEVRKVKGIEKDAQVVKSNIAKLQGDLDSQNELLKAQRNKLAQAEMESTRVQDDLAVKTAKQKTLTEELAQLPKDMKVETLSEDINRMKKEKLEFEALAEAKKKEVAAEEEKVAGIQKRLDDVVHKIEDRRKSFDRNSLAARVLAVNHDWGFVVIDAGKSIGLTEETKMIVTRGNMTVGKVSISEIQDTRALATIVPNSVANGEMIMPGDRVILENLAQN